MTKAEIDHLAEIEFYKKQLSETKSQTRKRDLEKYIRALEEELEEYRGYMYGR